MICPSASILHGVVFECISISARKCVMQGACYSGEILGMCAAHLQCSSMSREAPGVILNDHMGPWSALVASLLFLLRRVCHLRGDSSGPHLNCFPVQVRCTVEGFVTSGQYNTYTQSPAHGTPGAGCQGQERPVGRSSVRLRICGNPFFWRSRF